MDPVNKWLTLVAVLFITLIIAIVWKAGGGKYEIYVTDSTYENYQMVYVLNTRNGEVKAKMHYLGEHMTKEEKVKDYAVDVIDELNPGRYSYKYSYGNRPLKRTY
jgi:capsular polysaccharide biosynthesis protein